MNKIELQKTVKSPKSKYKIIGEYVIINQGTFKNGNSKVSKCKIVQLSAEGIYCDNDEFYKWDIFN